VDVAGALLDGVLQQGVDELDDGRVVRRVEQVFRLLADLARDEVEVLCGVLGERVGLARAAIVDLVDGSEDGALVRELELDLRPVEEQTEVVEWIRLQGIRRGDVHRAVLVPEEGHDAVRLGEGDRDFLDQLLVDVLCADLRTDRQAQMFALRREHFVGRDVAAGQEMVDRRAAPLDGLLASGLELLLVELRRRREDLEQAAGAPRSHRCCGFTHGVAFGITTTFARTPWTRRIVSASSWATSSSS